MKINYIYAIGVIFLLLGIVTGMAIFYTITTMSSSSGPITIGACTREAMLCPDGSSVERTGPNCEFAECPSSAPVGAGSQCVNNSNCPNGYECVDASPVAREGIPGNLRCLKSGGPRPICLSGETKISTPFGDILVKDIREKMTVWSTDKNGKKVESAVLLTGKTLVSKDHKVAHIILSDDREIFVSPGHKIADGRTAGELEAGDKIEGVNIKSAELIPYTEKYTYDILPSGDTGVYYANGILLQSTLSR